LASRTSPSSDKWCARYHLPGSVCAAAERHSKHGGWRCQGFTSFAPKIRASGVRQGGRLPSPRRAKLSHQISSTFARRAPFHEAVRPSLAPQLILPILLASARACGRAVLLPPFYGRSFQKAFRSIVAVSFRETRLRAAFSSSGRGAPGRRCSRGLVPALVQSFQIEGQTTCGSGAVSRPRSPFRARLETADIKAMAEAFTGGLPCTRRDVNSR
jgi:hypothetical protein